MNTQLKIVTKGCPAESAEDLYQAFKNYFGNYKPIDAAVRVVTAYYRGECDDLDFVMDKMAHAYHTETAARMIARRASKKDEDYSFKVNKANCLGEIINHLEFCLK